MVRTPSRDVEEGLLDAAAQILATEGPGALTVRKVATCAGVAPMGIYNRFNGKQGLLEALFVRGFRQLRSMVAAANGPDAMHRLRAGCLAYREFAVTHPEQYGLMFNHMAEIEPSEAAQLEAFASFDQLTRNVSAARQLRALGSGSDVEVAQQIWSALHGAVSLELSGMTFTEDPAHSYAQMLDALLAGLEVMGQGP
jgi:AcrR family transcriptional regulator